MFGVRFPDPPKGDNLGQQLYHARAEQRGELGLPGCDEALSGMGGASLTSEVPGVSKRRFSSEVGYDTPPRFPQSEHSPDSQKKPTHEVATDVTEMPFDALLL